MLSDIEICPKVWREQFKKHYITQNATWTLKSTAIDADLKITGLWRGERFELFCSSLQILSKTSPPVTTDVFLTLPLSMKKLLIQPLCEHWFSLVGGTAPDIFDIDLVDNLTFDSQLDCECNNDLHTEMAEFTSWLFHAADAHDMPLLATLIENWPKHELIIQPQPPSIVRFISGLQPITKDELNALHTGALLRQGYIFYPSLIATVSNIKQATDLPYSAILMEKSDDDHFNANIDIELTMLDRTELWLIYQLTQASVPQQKLEQMLTDGITNPGLCQYLSGCMVNIYLYCHGEIHKSCGQGEIVSFLDSYALLISHWQHPLAEEAVDA